MDSNSSVSLCPTQETPSTAAGAEHVPLQFPLKESLSHHSSSGTYLPIRAPPSSDYDIEASFKIDRDEVGSGSTSGSSVESFESESGEDGFETASERHFVEDPEEETLELSMEGEGIDKSVIEPMVGSSNFSLQENSGAVVADGGLVCEVEDDGFKGVVRVPSVDGFEKPDNVVESPKLGVLGGEGGGEDQSSIALGEGIPGAIGIASKDSKTIEAGSFLENPTLDEKPENGVLASEVEKLWLKNNPILDSVSVGDRLPGITEVSVEGLVGTKEDILPENLILDEGVDPATGRQEEKMVELNNEIVEEKTSEILGGCNTASTSSTTGRNSVVDTKEPVGVEENGDSDIKEMEFSVDKSAVLCSGNSQASLVVEELIEPKFVEADKDLHSIKGGDLFVETKQPISLGLEACVGGDVEENRVFEIKTLKLMVERSVSSGIGSDQATAFVEESVDPPLVDIDITKVDVKCSSYLETITNSVLETLEPDMEVSKTYVAEMETGFGEKKGGAVDESVSLDMDNSEKRDLDSETQIDLGARLIEPIVQLVADGVESVPSDKVGFLNEAQISDPYTNSVELNSVQDEKSLAPITEDYELLENCDAFSASQGDGLGGVLSSTSHTPESAIPSSIFDLEVKREAEDEIISHPDYQEEDEGSDSDEDTERLIFHGSETAEQIMKELEQGSSASSHLDTAQDHSQRIDGQIVTDSDEELDTDDVRDRKELFNSDALAALLKAATSTGSEDGSVTITSPDGSRLFSVERPAGLGSSIRSPKPALRPNQPKNLSPLDLMVGGESDNSMNEEEKKKLEKIQLIRVKFLRLVHRLGHSPEDSVVAQVLYRLVLVSGRHTSQIFSLETAKKTALRLEAEGNDDLDFSLNILVLGKTGVGKSATINSIFGEQKTLIDAFEPATNAIKEIIGTVGGVKIRVFDTPGLKSSVKEQAFNRKILLSVKKFTKKCPPDILLYVDRMDTQSRDLNDLPLLRSITTILGSSIWRSAILTLTHAASAPPDGPSGSPLSYDVFVAQRSRIVQQSIGQAMGDLRMMNPSLMNPVSLVENHLSCRRNREGQRVLPNGQSWRPQLLLLCYSMKILSEVSSISKAQDPFDQRKLFGFRVRSPPLPYLLSSLLQSRAHPKLPTDQGGETADSDIDLDDLSDSDKEEEDEYDQLPPFKPLRKSQISKLSKEQRKAYFDEYDYRVKLLQKKQWREELQRMREVKKKGDGVDGYDYMGEDVNQENEGPAAVPVPLPDMILPPSFDGDNPAYRYRFLEPTSQLLARPVLDTHGWDHDCGYDGVSLEENLAIASQFPAGVGVQITKDKKEFNIHLDSSVAAKHGKNGLTLAGFDIQTMGKQLAYILRCETKFKNLKKNKTSGGVCITFLGENVATGVKIEDQVAIGKRLTLVGSTGSIRSQGDAVYGANMEVRFKEKDYPIGQDQSTLGLSLVKWKGDLALGANLQSQFSIGRNSKISVRVGLNNKFNGQITVRTSSSEHLQIALAGVLPIAIAIYKSIWPGASESYSAY